MKTTVRKISHAGPIGFPTGLGRLLRRTPVICTAGILAFVASAGAATITWDGGAAPGDPDWVNPTNWVGNVAPAPFDALIFDGLAGLNNVNGFAANTAFGGLTFNANAGAFTLTGNAIDLNGSLTSNSALTQTINLNLALQATPTVRVSSGGTLVINGAVNGFGLTKIGTGTLVLNNALNAYSGGTTIHGGVLSLGTTGAIPTPSSLTISTGELSMTGMAAGPRSQSLDAVFLNAGRSVITLNAAAGQATTLTAASLGFRAVGAVTLYRGTNLGVNAPGTPGSANLVFTSAPAATIGYSGVFAATGSGTLGTIQAAVLRGALADISDTGNGTSFATYDETNGVRLLNSATEQTTNYGTAVAGDNALINLTAPTSISGKQTNTLQVANTTGGALTLTNSGTALWPNNGLLFTGNSPTTLTGGTLTFTNASGVNNDMIIMSTNTATVTISTALASGGASQRSYVFGGSGNFIITSNVGSSGAGGNYFNGPGNVELRGSAYSPSSAGTIVNGGTVKLGTGFGHASNNTRPLSVGAAGTFDINNFAYPSTATSGVDAVNNVNGVGGAVTNSGGTVTNFTLSLNNAQGDFSGVVGGNLNLIVNKQGTTANRTQKFTNALTYVGSTGVTSSSATETAAFLTIGSGGSLPSTTAVTLGGVIGTAGVATGSGVLTLGDFNGAVNQTVASLSSGGTGFGNAVVGGATEVSTLTVNGSASTTFAGTLGGFVFNNDNLALTRAGTGTLTLNGESTYIGGTIVSGGTLRVNNTTGSGTGSANVSVLSGGTLGGSGIITGPLDVASGGHLAPGTGVGTLTLGTVTLSSGSILDWEFNAVPVNDRINVTATDGLMLNGGGFNLYQENTTTPFDTLGTYNLIQFAGAVQGAGTTALSVLNPQFGRAYAFGASGNFITLTIGSLSIVSNWVPTGGGSWNTAGNWSSNPTIPNVVGAIVNFGASATAPASVALDGSKTVGVITFNNASSYTIAQGSGGSLVMDNGTSNASITANAGSHTISAPVSLASTNTVIGIGAAADTLSLSGVISGTGALTKTGSGTLVLSNNNSFAGGATLTGGVTRISGDASLGAASGTLSIGNAILEPLGSLTTARTVQISSAESTLRVNNADVVRLDGPITDGVSAGTLKKTGTGTLILTGAASYTGGTVIGEGTLQVGNGGASGSLGAGTVVIDGTLAINRSGALGITGALSGAGPLAMTGGGVLTLGATSGSYTGAVTVTDSTLSFGASAAAGAGTLILSNATLTQNNVSTSHANAVEIQGTLTVDTGPTNLTLNGNVTGNAAITRSGGTGSLTFGGFNSPTFSGSFTNSSGNVSFTRKEAGSLAAKWTFNGGGVTLTNMGGTINFGALSGSANIAAAGSVARLRVGDLGLDTTYSGNLSAATNGISLHKTGGGTLTLSGQNANFTSDAITGLTAFNTVITAGAVIAGSSTTGTASGPLGGSGANILLGSNGTLGNAGLLIGGAFNLGNPITVSGGTANSTAYTLTLGGNSDNAAVFSNSITLQNDLTISQAVTSGSNALTFAGAIAGTAAGTGPGGTSPNNIGTQTLTFAGPGAIAVSGSGIANGDGTVGVRSTGGVTTLDAVNTYTGSTQVTGGTLLVNGSIAGSATTVSGGVLGGNGTLGAVTVSAGGNIAPGNSAGILSTGSFDLQSGAVLSIELGGTTPGTGYDRLNVSGGITLAGDLQGSLISGFTPSPADLFFIILNDGADPIAGTFANAASTVGFGGFTFAVHYGADAVGNTTAGGNDVALTLVPEPNVACLLLGSLVASLGLRRRRRAE